MADPGAEEGVFWVLEHPSCVHCKNIPIVFLLSGPMVPFCLFIALVKLEIKMDANCHPYRVTRVINNAALVSVIITLLNGSERLLNKKWLRPVTNKSNAPNR